jgi:hypothetical protein
MWEGGFMNKKKVTYIVYAIIITIFISGIIYYIPDIKSVWGKSGNSAVITSPITMADGIDRWYMGANDAYIYPVSPIETPEIWKTFTDHVQMMNALQIPNDVLLSMSTAGLVETCVNYPLYRDYIRYDSYYSGIKMIERNFNGLRELYQRDDAASELVKFYQSINIDSLYTLSRFPQYQLSFIEFVIANDNIVKQMSKEERLSIMNSVLGNTYKRDSAERYSMEDVSKALLLSRVLTMESTAFQESISNDNNIKEFIQTGNMLVGDQPMIGKTARTFIDSMDKIVNNMN